MSETDRITTEREESEINLTPMLDVVFIMLIFFVVTAVFVKEPGIDITRPKASTATEQTSALYVAIGAENEIWVAGEAVEIESLRFHIERMRAENPQSGLVIQADADANNKSTLAVMDAAKAAGISSVALATERL